MARPLAEFSSLLRTGSSLAEQQEEALFPPLAVPALAPLLKNLPRGGIVELTGPRSSGRMAVLLHVLAQATGRGEVCAVLDTHDQFSPASAASAGVRLQRVVWVRCQNRPDYTLRAADLLLHAGGFGVVALDLPEVTAETWNRIPISWWHRFRRAVEHTPTIVLLCVETTQARACSRVSLELESRSFEWEGATSFALLHRLQTLGRLRKPVAPRATPLSILAVR